MKELVVVGSPPRPGSGAREGDGHAERRGPRGQGEDKEGWTRFRTFRQRGQGQGEAKERRGEQRGQGEEGRAERPRRGQGEEGRAAEERRAEG